MSVMTKRILVNLPSRVYEDLKHLAKAEYKSISGVIRESIITKLKSEFSKTEMEQQIGNAVPVNLGYHIGRCAIAMLAGKKMEFMEEVRSVVPTQQQSFPFVDSLFGDNPTLDKAW